MRKFIITLAVFGTFIIYSLGIRQQSPLLSMPASLATSNLPIGSVAASPVNTSSGGTPPSGAGPTTGQYKDGTYTGSVADAYYGNVQVSTTVTGGKLTAVKFIQHPDTRSTSVEINQQAMPYLQQEAIQAQSSRVQVISGATYTSQAFIQSLASAFAQAKA